MRTFHLAVTGDEVTRDSAVAGVQGSGNVDQVVVCFDAGWDGLTKSAQWFDAHGGSSTPVLFTAEKLVDLATDPRIYMTTVPPEALRYTGECTLVLSGIEEGRLAKTASQTFQVLRAPAASSACEEVTPSQVEQLQGEIDAMLGALSQDAADARQGAREAAQSAQDAAQSALRAQEASSRGPYVGDNQNWFVWDPDREGYRDSGICARGTKGDPGDQGEPGPQGPKGDTGDVAALVDLETGVFAMGLSAEGHLLVAVSQDETFPPLSIDDQTGHLVYTIEIQG